MLTGLPRVSGNSYQRLVENLIRHLDGDPSAELVIPERALNAVSIIDAIQR